MRWRRTYSDRKVFLVRSLLVEDIFGLEDGFEDVGFSILVSLTCQWRDIWWVGVTHVGACPNERGCMSLWKGKEYGKLDQDPSCRDVPTPTLILFLLVSFLKFSVTPAHQRHSFILQHRVHTKNRILRTISSVSQYRCSRRGNTPLRNLLPEVSDAWG